MEYMIVNLCNVISGMSTMGRAPYK